MRPFGPSAGWPPAFVATIHPSALLRLSDADRAAGVAAFIADLRGVAKLIR